MTERKQQAARGLWRSAGSTAV